MVSIEKKEFKLGKKHRFEAFSAFKAALENAKNKTKEILPLDEVKFIGISKIIDSNISYFSFELTNSLTDLKNSLALISDQNTINDLIFNNNEQVISEIESKMENPYHSYVNTLGKLI